MYRMERWLSTARSLKGIVRISVLKILFIYISGVLCILTLISTTKMQLFQLHSSTIEHSRAVPSGIWSVLSCVCSCLDVVVLYKDDTVMSRLGVAVAISFESVDTSVSNFDMKRWNIPYQSCNRFWAVNKFSELITKSAQLFFTIICSWQRETEVWGYDFSLMWRLSKCILNDFFWAFPNSYEWLVFGASESSCIPDEEW